MTQANPNGNTLTPDLQAIQMQIQDSGVFSPLHWLLQVGIIPFPEYEQWRNGQYSSLDGLFLLPFEQIKTLAEEALCHTNALKLSTEPQSFFSWKAEISSQPLKLSDDPQIARWLGARWLRPEDVPQMDLFMDSGAATAENELMDSLSRRNWAEAEQAYHHLSEVSPGNCHLAQYETLILYGKHMAAEAVFSQQQAEEELTALVTDIKPVADELLRHQATDYLSAAWQRLARNLPVSEFDPARPCLHASYALAQLPDWPAVIDSIMKVPDFYGHSDLIMRLAEAFSYQQPEVALVLWSKIVELNDMAEDLLDKVKHGRFTGAWNSFWELDLDIALFPAYVLLNQPGLIHHLSEIPEAKPIHPTFNAVEQLLTSGENQQKELAAREILNDVSPDLLKVYLSRQA